MAQYRQLLLKKLQQISSTFGRASLVCKHTEVYTQKFLDELNGRITAKGLQVTTDGFGQYVNAMYCAFEDRVDYARLIKNYS